MYRSQSLYLKLFHNIDQWRLQELVKIFSTSFDEKKGFGFRSTEKFDSTIESTLIYQSIVSQQVFDLATNTLTSQAQQVFYQAPFRLDYGNKVLLSYVGGRRLQKLLSVLGQVLGFKITIEDVYINLGRLLDELDSRILTYTLVGMNIRNFCPRSGISGQFSASVEDQQVALDLISTYKTDVTNIILQLFVSDETTSIWRVSSVGKIVVRTEEDLIEEQMELIKDIVLRCQNA